jgi:NhaA family Na+:H+ antiporter|tara:strand:- start:30 stop:1241 length:1212 start_codon:yes stop_codon:yes gene_type:complete
MSDANDRTSLQNFFTTEAIGGMLLLAAAIMAMILKNSAYGDNYSAFLETPVAVTIGVMDGALDIQKPLLLWINDGLMAIFFFMIGMEVKREILIGQFSDVKQTILPIIAGIGGIAVPAICYYLLTADNPEAIQGWAIPTATDIAFALGILALVGPGVPIALKLFLMTLAIIDDIGALAIIAFFFTSKLSITAIIVAGISVAALITMSMRGVTRLAPYIFVGLILWVSVLKSGVHATLAGVILGFCIPMGPREPGRETESPLQMLIHEVHPWAAFFILPLFAFANAGISLEGMKLADLFTGVPLAIMVGLFVGKQVGVFGFSWLAIKMKLCELPEGVSWQQLYGAAMLCGVGFTMSLFIGSLAFEEGGVLGTTRPDRLGIIAGSLLAGIAGFVVLKLATPNPKT